jgi:hypothetical protein
MTAALDISRLEKVRESNGKTTAACPVCRAAGSDKAGDHLVIMQDGKYGCLMHPGNAGAKHRKQIFAMVGVVEKKSAPFQQSKKPVRIFPTAEAAVRGCTPQGATFEAVYLYQTFAAVGRYRVPGDKEIRQFHPEGAGWAAGGPSGKWPLFLINKLPETGPVHVFEGEGKTLKANGVGMTALSPAGGAQAATKTDWKPLAGRDVWIWLDCDEPGEKWGATVAGIITALTPPGRVKIVRVPYEMGSGKDIADYLEDGAGLDDLDSLIKDAPVWEPATLPAIEIEPPPLETTAIQAHFYQIMIEKGLTTPEKYKRMAGVVVTALLERGRFFFHADFRDHATAMYFDKTKRTLQKIEGDEFQSWLAGFIGVNRSDRPYGFIFSAIQDEALTGETTGLRPGAFWDSRPGAVYLSNGAGGIVKITAEGVFNESNGIDDILFANGRTLEPWKLTAPADPFATCRLFRDMATTAPHGKDLLRLWMLSLPTNQRCKPVFVLSGGVGSGKTRCATGIFELYGLPQRVTAIAENGEGDFWTALDAGGLVCFDNADTRVKWLPDALAAAATDGQHEKRRLYSDSGLIQQRAHASAVVTSANPTFAADAGLADRLLVVRLDRRIKDTAESALSDEIAANRNAALSFIAETLSRALGDKTQPSATLNRRHPDFASMAFRIGRAIGREAETVAALSAAESDKSLFNLQNDDLGAGLLALMANKQPFSGTSTELLDALKSIDATFADSFWTAKKIGKRLGKLWPHLEGVFKARENRAARGIEYRFTPQNDVCAICEGNLT